MHKNTHFIQKEGLSDMKLKREDMLLYAVTDRTWLNGRRLYDQVKETLEGGATIIQIREKDLDDESFIKEALEIKSLCSRYNVPLIINDNIDVALKVNADGVHVGQDDMNAKNVRALLGSDKIIGVSAHNVEEALAAVNAGADYLGSGAAFSTDSKSNVNIIDRTELKNICKAVDIPVTAIGGINEKNILELSGLGISGVAVISAIFAADDIKEQTIKLKQLARRITE